MTIYSADCGLASTLHMLLKMITLNVCRVNHEHINKPQFSNLANGGVGKGTVLAGILN